MRPAAVVTKDKVRMKPPQSAERSSRVNKRRLLPQGVGGGRCWKASKPAEHVEHMPRLQATQASNALSWTSACRARGGCPSRHSSARGSVGGAVRRSVLGRGEPGRVGRRPEGRVRLGALREHHLRLKVGRSRLALPSMICGGSGRGVARRETSPRWSSPCRAAAAPPCGGSQAPRALARGGADRRRPGAGRRW
jgi:hypothetical protein